MKALLERVACAFYFGPDATLRWRLVTELPTDEEPQS